MANGYWHISARNLEKIGDGVYRVLNPVPHVTKVNNFDEEYPAFSVYKPVLLDLDKTIEVMIDGNTKSHFGKIVSFFHFDDMGIDDQNVEITIGTFSNITYKCLIAMNDEGYCFVTFTGATGSH